LGVWLVNTLYGVEKSGRFLLARPPKNRPLISTPASGVLGTVLPVGLKSAYVLIYRKRNVAERRGFDLDLVRVFLPVIRVHVAP
jgi:hypothetical protein